MNRQASVDALSLAFDGISTTPYGRRKSVDDVTTSFGFNKASPFGKMLDVVRREATVAGLWNEDMHRDLPKRWEKHGNIIVFPQNSFQHKNWRLMGRELWRLVAESLNTERVGRKRQIADDELRTPHVDLLYGQHGWVEHIDNGIKFNYDVTKCMFNIGNAAERYRIGELDCHSEVIVDMFAGIGYYTLPFLVNAGAKHVYAVDWNDDATEALKKSLEANDCAERCTVLEGDCRRVCPSGVADRVNMALIPTTRPHWLTACKCLKPSGGVMHIHETIRTIKKAKSPEKMLRLKRKPKVSRTESLGSVSEETTATDSDDVFILPKQDANNNTSVSPSSSVTTVLSSEDHGFCDEVPSPTKRKFSRSASIVEELENRELPPPFISEALKKDGHWDAIPQNYRDFAIDCATRIIGYLNNIHLLEGQVFTCTIDRLEKLKTYTKHTDHVNYRDFAIDCATRIIGYLNNIHLLEGQVFTCTIDRLEKLKTYTKHTDHVVLDVTCRPQSELTVFADKVA
uniref:tRNA(Phe) (4-demethylwyosine(37)-C(7)) aminocarboxypropyltransferase n=1 Tax=Steinernema glaseri TaxID=37863 RepID=A0A1I7ZRT5_9BILA